MRDTLPAAPLRFECGVVNLDVSTGSGTHWCCYHKRNDTVLFFDPFGNLPPPLELQRYFSGCLVQYNYDRVQRFATSVCGQLCLKFLYAQCRPRTARSR